MSKLIVFARPRRDAFTLSRLGMPAGMSAKASLFFGLPEADGRKSISFPRYPSEKKARQGEDGAWRPHRKQFNAKKSIGPPCRKDPWGTPPTQPGRYERRPRQGIAGFVKGPEKRYAIPTSQSIQKIVAQDRQEYREKGNDPSRMHARSRCQGKQADSKREYQRMCESSVREGTGIVIAQCISDHICIRQDRSDEHCCRQTRRNIF